MAKLSSQKIWTIITSLLALLTFVSVDYFSLGMHLFTVKGFVDERLVAFSSTIFLTTTYISQLVISLFSSITTGLSASIIFESMTTTRAIATQCHTVLAKDGQTVDVPSLLTNIYACMVISTLLFSVISMLPWIFKKGNMFQKLPLQPIFAALIAIGVDIIITTFSDFPSFDSKSNIWLFVVSVIGAAAIYMLELFFPNFTFLIPASSVVIILVFNLIFRFFLGYSTADLKDRNFILNIGETVDFNVFKFTSLFTGGSLSKRCIFTNIKNILSMVGFNMLHLSINLSQYALVTGAKINYNREWLAQSVSNMLTALFGYPSYFVGSTSILFYKAGARSRSASFFGMVVPAILAFVGPYVRDYIPNILSYIILLYVGFSFASGPSTTVYSVASWADILIIVLTVVLCRAIGFAPGFIFGVTSTVTYMVFVINNYVHLENKGDKAVAWDTPSDVAVIKAPHTLWFVTLDRFKKCINMAGDDFTLDMTGCAYVDMSANMFLIEVAESGRKICILGRPTNIYYNALGQYENVRLLDRVY